MEKEGEREGRRSEENRRKTLRIKPMRMRQRTHLVVLHTSLGTSSESLLLLLRLHMGSVRLNLAGASETSVNLSHFALRVMNEKRTQPAQGYVSGKQVWRQEA